MVLVLVVGIEKFPYYLAWASTKTALPVYVIKRDQSVPSVVAFGITEYMIVFSFCSSKKITRVVNYRLEQGFTYHPPSKGKQLAMASSI